MAVMHPTPHLMQAEHIVTSHNTCSLTPLPISFVAAGLDADGHQTAMLPPGLQDGQDKTVAYEAAPPGCSLRVAGCQIHDSGGAAQLKWNIRTQRWVLVGGFNVTTPIPAGV
jgi:hypothetical protein